jgi:cell division protein FtsQ
LPRLDTAAIARRVEALPVVATARVRLRYPSTIVITVVERSAVGYVADGTNAALVDRTGQRYLVVPGVPPGLPRFVLPAGSGGGAAGRAAATVAAALPAELRSLLTSIEAGPSGLSATVTLNLRDGRTVRWGGAERSADKARLLPALLAQPGHVYDVSDPDLVYTR